VAGFEVSTLPRRIWESQRIRFLIRIFSGGNAGTEIPGPKEQVWEDFEVPITLERKWVALSGWAIVVDRLSLLL
jgi:hypothetical protein